VPDGNRYWTSIGATWKFSDDWALEGAYTHIFFDDAVLGTERGFFAAPIASTVTSNAVGTVSVETLSLSLRRRF
jgi:long-chain fatty acid transport protein